MSKKHPVIAVTGSSGAGTTTVKTAFEHIFRRLEVTAAIIEGDSYHKYNRAEMKRAIADATARGENISHFGPDANLLCELAEKLNKSAIPPDDRRALLDQARGRLRPVVEDSRWAPLASTRDTDDPLSDVALARLLEQAGTAALVALLSQGEGVGEEPS